MAKKGIEKQPLTLSFPLPVYGLMNDMYRQTHISKTELVRAGVVLLYKTVFKNGEPDIVFLNRLVTEGNAEVTQT